MKIILTDTGGGISVWFTGQANNNSVEVILSNFINNTANIGGGLNVHSRENATHNHVKFRSAVLLGIVVIKKVEE